VQPKLELAFRVAELFDLPIEAVLSPRPFAPLGAQV
jgi:DNA-binding XRE family transcriptional regulator